ncbi:MAG: hypothetical protein JSC189_000111 [Candidatus Tokpelaia sp. JSC189]|nr:MAG: hypothetical protein JSC189_000111 [Candidatus Tokpelaia sp. JSC189]
MIFLTFIQLMLNRGHLPRGCGINRRVPWMCFALCEI